MKAGRDLDALVAEKVLGWQRQDIYEFDEMGELGYVQVGSIPTHIVPHYSTNIADAWRVVEKFISGNWGVLVEFVPEDGVPGYWRAALFDAHYDVTEAEGETASHAICLAALKAVSYTSDGT